MSAALADPDPQAALAALAALVQATVGARLYTVMALDPDTGMARRVWTSDPDTYPVGGEKPLPENPWTEIVIRARRTWVANTPEEVAGLLFDHATIARLGCGAALNLPVTVGGLSIDRQCCGGMDAVMLADALIQFLAFKRWSRILLVTGPAPGDALYAEALKR